MSKKVLIAGEGPEYENYIKACESIGLQAELSLSVGDISSYDGLILPGGCDINPARYGEEIAGSENIDNELDEKQFSVLDLFIKAEKPVLGICRGSQLLNVYFGGSLIQHIEGHRLENEGLHNVHIESENSIYEILGAEKMVNSAHHQCVGRLGNELKIIARSDDNIVEAFVHNSKRVLGVQWHPERIMDFGGREIYEIFKNIL